MMMRTHMETGTSNGGTSMGRVQRAVKQTRVRILAGDTKSQEKMLSLFEPLHGNHSQGESQQADGVWQAGPDSEAEHQIITHFEVFGERPSDQELLLPSVQKHQTIFGRVPHGVAADAGFYSQANEQTARRWAAGHAEFRCRIEIPRVWNAVVCNSSAGSVRPSAGGPVVKVASVC